LLLVVLLAEHRNIGLHKREKPGDNRGDAIEMTRSRCALRRKNSQ
jgi:hypothetical protein